MAVGPYYYGRDRGIEDLADGDENVGGHLEAGRVVDGAALIIVTTHFGGLAMGADAVLVLNGQLASDKPPRSKCYIGNRRATTMANHRKGRQIGRRKWSRFIQTVRDTADVLGGLDMVGDAACGLNGTVVAPNEVLGAIAMVGDAAITLAGGVVLAVIPGQGLTLVGDAAVTASGSEIFGSPQLVMKGDAKLQMRGSGGADASLDASQRRGGIVTIGTRGGHA